MHTGTTLSDAELAERAARAIARTHAYTARQLVEEVEARAVLAHKILDEILAFVQPGKKESEVREYAESRIAAHGCERTWHPPYVRFGEHTLLTFMDTAKEDRVLKEEDIAFVDIGIVKGGIEGDAGRTLVFGENAAFRQVQEASETIFREAREYWSTHNPPGIRLYEHIHEIARRLDVEFILDPAGHLIGAFPHAGWKRGINHFPEPVEAGKWILEIQVRHPRLPCGAFFEDLLR